MRLSDLWGKLSDAKQGSLSPKLPWCPHLSVLWGILLHLCRKTFALEMYPKLPFPRFLETLRAGAFPLLSEGGSLGVGAVCWAF